MIPFEDAVNALNFVGNGYGRILRSDDCVLAVSGTSDRPWTYLAAAPGYEQEAFSLLKPGEDNLAAVSDEIFRLKPGNWRMRAGKYFFEGNTPEDPMELHGIDISDAEDIYNLSDYSSYLSLDYVTDRISRGISVCHYSRGRPVAWAMTHDDGALGFLHVLPEFRRQGLGAHVLRCAVSRIIAAGKTPFVHIEERNSPSVRLALKSGFRLHSYINWTGS